MKNTVNLDGKATLIFVLEYDTITGGMLHSVTSLIKEITTTYNIIIICPLGPLALTLKDLPVTVITIGDIDLWHSKKALSRLILIRKIYKVIKQYLNNAPIIITNNIYAQLLVSICSYFARFKVVYFNRGGELKNKISKLVILLSHHITLVFSTSSNQNKIVEQSGLLTHGAKNIVLYNPVSLDIKPAITHSYNQKTHPFILGIVGYIDEGKNQLLALDALYILRQKNINVHLHLYGEANNHDYLNKLHHKIETLSLAPYVNFEGFVKEKERLYHSIDLLLSTSIAEGFGRTIVEAMLAKKPVVALKIAGGPLDIIISENYGLLVDNDSKSVANAVEKFITDETYKKSVIENAHQYALTHFNPQTIANNFVNILEKEVL